MGDPSMQLLGGDQGKAVFKVEAHLLAEQGERACARAIALGQAGVA